MAGKIEEARARADSKFKRQETAMREAEKVWAELEATSRASDKNKARLKALRLAKEAEDVKAAPAPKKKPTPRKKAVAAT